MRAFEKKKLFKLAIKAQVRAGRINEAGGGWTRNDERNSMGRDLRAGHREGKRG
jgi:hypothetical protein